MAAAEIPIAPGGRRLLQARHARRADDVRQGSRHRVPVWLCAWGAGLVAAFVPQVARSQVAGADQGKVSAWASGGTSTTAQPGDKDGKPTGGPAPGAVPFWQAPALPSAVVQGGAIPPGWQPQAVPYQGIGPDGRPMTMYFAPTYVFTYQSGPPVLAVPGVNRPQARGAPPANGWNYSTSGAAPVRPGVPQPTVARYPPAAYQFPADARALTGTPITPPAGAPPGATAPSAAAMATAPAAPPALAPPPTEWAASSAPAPAAAPASSGDWMAVVPPAVAGAAIAANSANAGATAVAPAAPPPLASVAPPVSPIPPAGQSAAPAPTSAAPATSPRAANSHLWRVVGVHDGDTVTCLDENNQQQKIRLAEIDAPEIGQDYGKAAREALAGMVFGKTVEVIDDGRDRYGRWIGHLVVDGTDVNRQMVATGNAWHYAAYSSDQSLAAVQSQAQSQRIGLWSQPDPTPPWEFRKNQKKQG
jgi:micrococcal nuclease